MSFAFSLCPYRPAYCTPAVLEKAGLTLSDISVFEYHEAFAVSQWLLFVILDATVAPIIMSMQLIRSPFLFQQLPGDCDKYWSTWNVELWRILLSPFAVLYASSGWRHWALHSYQVTPLARLCLCSNGIFRGSLWPLLGVSSSCCCESQCLSTTRIIVWSSG